jgi:hypothetical protein
MNDSDYAIAVGISLYPEEFAPLTGAPRDATRFMEWVLSPDGGDVPSDNTRLIVTQLDQQPSSILDWKPDQDDVDAALIDFGLRQKWKRTWKGKKGKTFLGRRLYFYFAGHGYAPKAGNVGMLMADAAPSRLRKSLSLSDYRDFFAARALFEEIVFIVDCCRDPLPLGIDNTDLPSPPSFNLERVNPPPRTTEFVLLAAENGSKSYEMVDPETREPGGILTRLFLKALRDGTSADQGKITAAGIKRYMEAHLAELASRVDGRPMFQNPQFQGTAVELARPPELIFGCLTPAAGPTTVQVRIVVPESFTGELIVLEDGKTEIARQPAKQATKSSPPWVVELLPSKRYAVRHVVSPSKSKAAVIGWLELEVTNNVFVFPGDDSDN